MTGIAPQTELIIELLAKRLAPAAICRICSVTAATVSEVATKYAEIIEAEAIVANMATVELDEIKDRLEMQALQQLQKSLPLEMDPSKLVRIAQSLNTMDRRSLGERVVATAQAAPTLVLNMPTTFITNFGSVQQQVVLNQNSEVVAVGTQTTAPASRDQIEKLVAAKQPLAPAAISVEDI